MPEVYRIVIQGEIYSPNNLPVGAAGAVTFDDNEDGELVSYYLALRRDSQWIPIRHPIEDDDLLSNGETFSSAARKGILWGLDPNVCKQCGNISYVPKIRSYVPFGCSIPLISGVITGFIRWCFADVTFVQAVASAIIAMLLIALIYFAICELIAALRFRKLRMALMKIKCVECGSCNHVPVSSLSGKSLALDNGKVISVSMAGRS